MSEPKSDTTPHDICPECGIADGWHDSNCVLGRAGGCWSHYKPAEGRGLVFKAYPETTDQPPPSDAPYVFKRYLDGGGAVYEVRQQGRTLSIHPDARSAQEARPSQTEMTETAHKDIREALLAARGFVNWPAGVRPMQRVLALIEKALNHVPG